MFVRWLQETTSLGNCANSSNTSISKIKDCHDWFGFLMDPTKMIEILVFKDASDIGSRDLRNLFTSNFSRSNRLHSTLLKTINKYQLSIQSLKTKILSFDISKFHQMFENWNNNHNWTIVENKTKCLMSCVNSTKFKTLTFCNNNRKGRESLSSS